jgi:DNA invertase Pin-like site-specific DNA recombinase
MRADMVARYRCSDSFPSAKDFSKSADVIRQEGTMTADFPIPAAQYLRMSTEYQQYSPENQVDAITQYAEERGFSVVKTYTDAAKSGLRLKNRNGLKQLLKDVVDGKVDYRDILVYDVSRWGRFQDADESAHYEFLCKSARIPAHLLRRSTSPATN